MRESVPSSDREILGSIVQIRHTDVDPVVAGASIDGDEVRVFLSTPDLLGDATRLGTRAFRCGPVHISNGFVSTWDRRAARTSRILQRLALSQCSSVAPTSWEFTAEPLHKTARICGPEFAPPLEFSVSNTRGPAACAVTIRVGRVGIDVEAHRPQVPTSSAPALLVLTRACHFGAVDSCRAVQTICGGFGRRL